MTRNIAFFTSKKERGDDEREKEWAPIVILEYV